MKLHELKIKKEYFNKIIEERKTFELRKDDRNYQIGDLIHFVEVYEREVWVGPEPLIVCITKKISSKESTREFEDYENNLFKIVYILRNVPEYGLDKDYCILGIKKLEVK